MTRFPTVDGETEYRFSEKRSIFIATAFGTENVGEGLKKIAEIAGRYPGASHNCYGIAAGGEYRSSDDGEPSGTAGGPILNAVRKRGFLNTAVVVTRYFGGVKLGAGNLSRCYSRACEEVLKLAPTAILEDCAVISAEFAYPDYKTAGKLFFEGAIELGCVYSERVRAEIGVPYERREEFSEKILSLTAGRTRGEITGRKLLKTRASGGKNENNAGKA